MVTLKMKVKYLIIFAVGLSAVLLTGALYTYWTNARTPPKANIDAKVVYAYIGHPTVNAITAGFNYNTSQTSSNYNLASYVIILKATNNGAEMVSMTQFRAYIAQQITERAIGLNDSNGNPAPGSLGGPSFEISNTIISDSRTGLQTGGFSNYLDAETSRLIALTGVVSLNQFSEQILENLTVSVWGSVTAQTGYASGQSAWAPQSQTANDVEQIVFQRTGDDYLYNRLLGQNQTLVIDGLDAIVVGT